MSLPGEDVVRSMSSADTSKEDASEVKRGAAATAVGEEEVAADEDDPLISATSSMPMAAPDVAFTNKEDRAKSVKKRKKKRKDAKQGALSSHVMRIIQTTNVIFLPPDIALQDPAPPTKSGSKHRKKSRMQPPQSVQPNFTYDDPGMGRYLDDSFRWNAGSHHK